MSAPHIQSTKNRQNNLCTFWSGKCLVKFCKKKIETILIILAITTSVIAFEQMYARNCGGNVHTDSDGITYQSRSESWDQYSYKHWSTLDIGTVPESDKPIYYTIEYTFSYQNPLIYQLPLESDGLYVLIAKFTNDCAPGFYYIDMKLNDIQLISNVDEAGLCGKEHKSCDNYYQLSIIPY
jgi:Malectin domain